MTIKILSGRFMNASRRGTFTSFPIADTDYPASNLGIGRPNEPFVLSSGLSNNYAQVDLNFIEGGNFESPLEADGSPVGFTLNDAGSGTIELDTAIYSEGSQAIHITDEYKISCEYEHVTGKKYQLKAAIYGTGTEGGLLYVQNKDTLMWLASGNTWSSTKQQTAHRLASGWETFTRTFTIETDTTICEVPLNIECAVLYDSGSARFDSIYCYPEIDSVAVFGHNIPSGATVSFRRSDDEFDSNDVQVKELTVGRDAFFDTFANQLYRWYRFRVAEGDEMSQPLWLGELAMGHLESLATTFQPGPSSGLRMPQIRNTGSTGQVFATEKAVAPTTAKSLNFKAPIDTDPKEALTKLFKTSHWGEEPLIIIPDSAETEVIHCRVTGLFTNRNVEVFEGYHDYSVTLIGDPYPIPLFYTNE